MRMQRAAIFTTIGVGAVTLVAIGAALSGEREAAAPPAELAGAVAPASAPAPTSAPASAPAPARPAASAAGVKEARRVTALHAGEALAAYRGTFLERCWTPPPGSGPDHIDLRFNLAFDPQGTLVGLGISESRKAFRADVSACLRGLSVKLKIPPPGAPVQVQVPLTLP